MQIWQQMNALTRAAFAPCLAVATALAPQQAESRPATGPSRRPEIALARELASKHGLDANLGRFTAAAKHVVERSKGARFLTQTAELFDRPFALPDFADEVTLQLENAALAGLGSIQQISALGARLVNAVPPAEATAEPPASGPALDAGLASIELLLADASLDVQRALAKLDGAEQTRLRNGLPSLFDHFVSNIYIHQSPALLELWKLVDRVDLAPMFRAAQRLAPLADTPFLNQLAAQLRKRVVPAAPVHIAGVKGTLLFARETPSGWILVGDTGPNAYDVAAALIIDLGGNDTYAAQSTRSDLGRPVNVVIDLAGDDVYQGDGMFSQACGLLGLSILVDANGKDRYSAGRVAQGASAVGVGILIDRAGNDLYEGDAFVQGAGCFGMGCLADIAGDDVMNAKIDSMAFAWPRSAGFVVDGAGSDQRTATGGYGSSYGTPGEFAGQSLGAAFGFRFVACGGFAIFVDGGGDDITKVGEMGFGMGYYFGCGIVRDRGGNDKVYASRYGIAAAAHQALSAVIDDRGNDLWDNAHTASIAGNWDTTYSFFLDLQGNDVYRGAGISTGGATITSLAVFVDAAGVDRYETTDGPSFGDAGHAEDAQRNTQSIAFFLDLGGGKDRYPANAHKPPLSNNSECVRRHMEAAPPKPAGGSAADGNLQPAPVESGVGLFLDR